MLYRPLFWTSYWCEDWIHSSNYRSGVSHILISSSSSKTAFCLAYLIRKRIRRGEINNRNTKIIGLTSKGNVDFTKRLELYHEVLDYDSFTSAHCFSQGGQDHDRWIYVDVAGNPKLNERIHAHFASPYGNTTGSKLAANIVLGLTNLQPSTAITTTPKSIGTNPFNNMSSSSSDATVTKPSESTSSEFRPREEFFFMPEWLDIRRHQIPISEIFRRQNQAWKELMEDCTGWVKLERIYGAAGVEKAYRKLLSREGLGPDKGSIWSLWDSDDDDDDGDSDATKLLTMSSKL